MVKRMEAVVKEDCRMRETVNTLILPVYLLVYIYI